MRPSLFWLATEGQRAFIEFGTHIPYRFMKRHKSGDGHPVLVLPGFMATDFSTAPLRSFLKRIGYNSYPWQLGRNFAEEKYLYLLISYVEEIYRMHGQNVSLIGWSLGGVFAREIAKRRPEIIRQIITLGSPFGGLTKPNNASWIHNILTGGRGADDVDPNLLENLIQPAPVPTTAVYTKQDGVVSWRVCIEKRESSIHQNIQVTGSHVGLGFNPLVLEIIHDRLQFNQTNWKRYYK